MDTNNRTAGQSRHSLSLALSIALRSPVTIESQICQQIRSLILNQALKPGAKLPSSRTLAAEIGCSRTPVLAAFEKLAAEGYIVTLPRSGIQVASGLELLERTMDSLPRPDSYSPTLSKRGASLASVTRRFGQPTASMPGHPAIEEFPFDVWGKLSARIWRFPSSSLVWGDDPAGYRPLREALANYLRIVRGLPCEVDEIIITSGTKQAIDLVGRILLDPGDEVVVEDPGWPSWWLLGSEGLNLTTIPVDQDGLDVEQMLIKAPNARMAAVSPSHQFPLGSTMSLARRLALLDWARKNGGIILEDDYDSEFRYAGEPLSALKSLDDSGHVIYIGTFTKSLFPSIRMGYMVMPRRLVADFLDARGAIDTFPPITVQPVLAAFIAEGHMAKHVKNMRRLYRERHEALLGAVKLHLAEKVDVVATEMGLTLPIVFKDQSVDDIHAAKIIRKIGLTAFPLSAAYVNHAAVRGVMIGLAALPEFAMDEAIRQLRAMLFVD